MCVHVSVLVSVYIIRVHCPLHHTLDTFYGLFAKKLKLHKKNITKIPNFYILTFCMKTKLQEIKVQEIRDENMI